MSAVKNGSGRSQILCELDQIRRWFAFRFLGEDGEINIETEHPEFSRWEWSPRDHVLGRIVPFKRATYRKVLNDFAHVFD